MVRRLFPVLVLALFLSAVPSALAAPSPTQTAQHDPGVETVSGADASPDGDAPPGATPEESVRNQWPAGTVETFRFNVAPGEENSGFTVAVGWPNPDIDFDIFVYRIRDNGTLDPDVIASAATADDPELVEYSANTPGEPVRQDEYIVAVVNYCTKSTEQPASCGYLGPPDASVDEDDWEAEVTFSAFDPDNVRPSVSLSGPTTGTVGEELTYTANASDSDGSIAEIRYDLDGDGTHETDGGGATQATTSFDSPGLRTVGVRVVDNEGAIAYSSVDVRITSAPTSSSTPTSTTPTTTTTTTTPAIAPLLSSFKLGRPVFGGVRNNRLTIRYRLRERSSVIVSLYRGSKRVARLTRGTRIANRTYRINVLPRRLSRGNYTVRIFVRSADGRRVQAARLAAKRL